MEPRVSQAELDRLFPTPASFETEQARGLFRAFLRARDALAGLGTLLQRVNAWAERRNAAAELHALTDRDLADIGLTRGDIEHALDGTDPALKAPVPAPSRPTVVLTRPARAAALAA